MSFFLDSDEDIQNDIDASGSEEEGEEEEVGWDSFLGSEKTPIVHSPTHMRTDDRRKKEMSAAELEEWFKKQCLARVKQGEDKQKNNALSQLRQLQAKVDDQLVMFSLDKHMGDGLVDSLVRVAMAEVKTLLAEFEKPEMWQKGRGKFVAAAMAANAEQAAAITIATQAETTARASTQLQTMRSKLGVSRQAAFKRVASSDKELTEDYEKQERDLARRIATERGEGEHVEALKTEAENMAADSAKASKKLEEEAERTEKAMLIKIRMLGTRVKDKNLELQKAQTRVSDLEREVSKRDRRLEILGNLNNMVKQDSMLTAHKRALSFANKMQSFNSDLNKVGGMSLKELGKRPSQELRELEEAKMGPLNGGGKRAYQGSKSVGNLGSMFPERSASVPVPGDAAE